MGSNWVSLLIDCVRILTPQRHFVWINGDENNDDDDHDGEANFCLCLRFYGVFTFVLNLVGSIVQVYIFKTAQEKKNVHHNRLMGVMGWTKSESTLDQNVICAYDTEQFLVKKFAYFVTSGVFMFHTRPNLICTYNTEQMLVKNLHIL